MGKHNPYWFKRRRYGYGWMPVMWQGWISVLLFLDVVLIGASILLNIPKIRSGTSLAIYLFTVALASVALFMISTKKGPTPKWRWGKAKHDNPKEDF